MRASERAWTSAGVVVPVPVPACRCVQMHACERASVRACECAVPPPRGPPRGLTDGPIGLLSLSALCRAFSFRASALWVVPVSRHFTFIIISSIAASSLARCASCVVREVTTIGVGWSAGVQCYRVADVQRSGWHTSAPLWRRRRGRRRGGMRLVMVLIAFVFTLYSHGMARLTHLGLELRILPGLWAVLFQ